MADVLEILVEDGDNKDLQHINSTATSVWCHHAITQKQDSH
jgi:hypothetical protein